MRLLWMNIRIYDNDIVKCGRADGRVRQKKSHSYDTQVEFLQPNRIFLRYVQSGLVIRIED